MAGSLIRTQFGFADRSDKMARVPCNQIADVRRNGGNVSVFLCHKTLRLGRSHSEHSTSSPPLQTAGSALDSGTVGMVGSVTAPLFHGHLTLWNF